MYGITEAELIEWNNIENNTLYIDQELVVEEPKTSVAKVVKKIQKEPSDSRWTLEYYTPILKTTYNNNYPIGQNDGALWQGKGLNSMISAGAYFSYGPVKASVRPNFIYNTNKEFPLSRWPAPEGISDFGYEFSVIDYPQRFGSDPISKIDPGQSWIRAEYNEFSAGFSTANMRLGPAIYNPIMMSNNAPGFLRIFIGTHKPFQTGIGSFEGELFWGRLDESDYFDEDESNDSRMINGLTLIYSPKYIKGLHVGLSKIAVKPQSDLSFGDYFLAFRRMESGQPSDIDRLQMFSLFSRWRIPDYGFEFYAEWARNTPPKSLRDLLLEPEYSRVYTMGFFKRVNLATQHWLTLNFELTQIERPRSIEFRPSQPFYRSSSVIQGYTHEGQLLGAGIGPGSNSQKVHLSYFLPKGMFGISFNRIVHDNTRLYENYMVIGERPWGIRNPRIVNEVEFRFGVNTLVFLLDRLELQVDLYRTKFFHHEHGTLDFENPTVYNTNLQFTLRYNFDNFLR
ncbi:MAG: LysM peptidoglycan-binding domain-containing protein [Balneolaceae bacterium]|nr:LysM peptidoglycan-binding domain-containing protein [Balneolaceae bacterium]